MTDRPKTDLLDGPDGDPDVTAAELALGLLDGDERAAALRRQLAEPAFAREVERWRAHFAALFAIIPEVAPAAELGERVIDQLDGRAPSRAGRWKAFSLISSLAAASLLGILLIRPAPRDPPLPPAVVQAAPLAVAAFTVEGQEKPVVAVYDSTRGTVRMAGPLLSPAGQSAQLWAIVGDQPPRPLGTFRAAEAGAVEADATSAMPIEPGTTLAISIEPLGGSPTGLPTGPVVATGTLARI